MTSTVNDIVRRALRAVGAIPAGKVPGGIDAESGLEHLQSLILDLPGLLKNGRFREVAVTAAFTARESDRCTVTAPGVVTLPLVISDHCNHHRTRPPLDLARVQILGPTATNAGLWVYSATNASWANVFGLTTSSDMPFGTEDDAGLAAQLAVNIAAEYGAEQELGQRLLAVAQISARSFRSRFKRSEPHDHHRPHDGFRDLGPEWGPFY